MSDLISRADAMGAVQDHFNADGFKGYDDGQKMMDRLKALPSAELILQTPQTYGKSINPSNAEVVADYISRTDAIKAVGEWMQKEYGYLDLNRAERLIDALSALPSAETPTLTEKHQLSAETPTDLISRADAIRLLVERYKFTTSEATEILSALPSAETTGALDDAIAKYVADGLMKLPSAEADSDGKLFKYKLKGGTVQSYEIVPSAEAVVQGEWVRKTKEYNDCDGHCVIYWYECSVCGTIPPKDQWLNEWHSNYCPSCGAKMKGVAALTQKEGERSNNE